MKYLGIDYGTKRIGLAVSDPLGTIAFPREILANDGELIKKIIRLIHDEGVTSVVVGKSLTLRGEENLLQRKIDAFINKLKEVLGDRVSFYLQDERMSSHAVHMNFFTKEEKHSRKRFSQKEKDRKTRHIDAEAAAVILQRFLDRNASQF